MHEPRYQAVEPTTYEQFPIPPHPDPQSPWIASPHPLTGCQKLHFPPTNTFICTEACQSSHFKQPRHAVFPNPRNPSQTALRHMYIICAISSNTLTQRVLLQSMTASTPCSFQFIRNLDACGLATQGAKCRNRALCQTFEVDGSEDSQ